VINKRDLPLSAIEGKALSNFFVSPESTLEIDFGQSRPRTTKPSSSQRRAPEIDTVWEVQILVWCAWRLQDETRVISGSDASQRDVRKEFRALVGETVTKVTLEEPGQDLRIDFESGVRMEVFCNHLGSSPSLDTNWEIVLGEARYFAGADGQLGMEGPEQLGGTGAASDGA